MEKTYLSFWRERMKEIYYHGTIYTMEKEGETVEAVCVEDGIITGTGSFEALKEKNKDASYVDLNHKTLLPAFIDAHSHILMAGQMLQFADLTGCSSFSDIQEAMKTYIHSDKAQDNDLFIGFGYDHNVLEEYRHPDRYVLDGVCSDKPVFILHVSGHMGVMNSKGLEYCGISKDTKDPTDGRYGRIAGTKEPDGYLEEGAMMSMQLQMSTSISMDPAKMLCEAQNLYLQNGITTAQDGASNLQSIQLFCSLAKKNVLTMDIVAYPMLTEKESIETMPESASDIKYDHHFRIGGYKLILDGSPQGKSAWFLEPYFGDEDYCGYPWLTDEQVLAACKQAILMQQQLLVHCNGDAASEQFVRCYEQAEKEVKQAQTDLRPVMIHCQTVRDEQLARMKPLEMIASFFVGHVYYWGDTHLKNLGNERGMRISPVATALQQDLCVTFHQDTPVTKPNMLHSVWCAVKRQTKSNQKLKQEECVSRYDAFAAITKNAAYQYHEEDTKGTITEGKRADFVLLSQNPFEVPVDELLTIQVIETIKDGAIVYQQERKSG